MCAFTSFDSWVIVLNLKKKWITSMQHIIYLAYMRVEPIITLCILGGAKVVS
jgi:hypothetical protein